VVLAGNRRAVPGDIRGRTRRPGWAWDVGMRRRRRRRRKISWSDDRA